MGPMSYYFTYLTILVYIVSRTISISVEILHDISK